MPFKLNPITNRWNQVDVPRVLASSAPTAADDGHSVPTLWIDTSTDKGYLLVDSTTGAAVWTEIGDVTVGNAVVYNSTDAIITLTTGDLNSILVINNAANVQVNLPSVGATDVGDWIEVQKMGAGNVTIVAADADVIADSVAGGQAANTVAAETWSFVRLGLLRAAYWGFHGMIGTWVTT